MKRLLTAVTATALSALLAVSSIDPAAAGPIQPMPQPLALQTTSQANGVTEVQYRHDWRHYRPRPHYRPHHRPGYWHGHRGYRYARPGYRRYHDGWWYPLAAFTAGAIIGGAAARPAHGSGHVRWCANRYRSYRVSDNTYQPTSGPRRQCVSP
ncbi:hypothetical protein FHX11_005281 [Rhizobium sp. BK602]|nr:hypothetical protein [Rhizobium sp. BK602]